MNIRPFSGSCRTVSSTNPTNPTSQVSISNNTFIGRLLRQNSTRNNTEPIRALEEVIDLEQNLDNYRNHQLNLLNPRVLYRVGPLNLTTSLLRISREEQITVTNEARNLEVISKETIRELKKQGKSLVHLGLIVVGIKGMTRRSLGAKVFVTILDKSWKNASKAVMALMEVDMNNENNAGLFYCTPDMLIGIGDVHKIVVGIQTKGYDEIERDDGNLLINIGFIGRLTNSSQTRYNVNIDGIINAIASKGIKLMKPKEISSEELAGLEWNINKNLGEPSNVMVPEQVNMFKNCDGSISARFGKYKNKCQASTSNEEYIEENE